MKAWLDVLAVFHLSMSDLKEFFGPIKGDRGAKATSSVLAVRQKLNKDRVSLTLRVTDPFSSEKERSITDDPRFYQTSERFRRARGLLLNLTWMFGKPIKGQKGDEIDLTSGAS